MTDRIPWKPIADLDTSLLHYERDTVLLWVPGMTVSGPGLVCYWQNPHWIIAATGNPLGGVPTHYAMLTEPADDDAS